MDNFRYLALDQAHMRNENESKILKMLQNNDFEELKEILKNPTHCRLGNYNAPILSAAVLKGNIDMINYLIDNGCDLGAIDKKGYSALDVLFHFGSYAENVRLEIADILLATCSNPIHAVFLNSSEYKTTPFVMACANGNDAIIMHFLALIDDTNSISTAHLIDYDGNNLFHHPLYSIYFIIYFKFLATVRRLCV